MKRPVRRSGGIGGCRWYDIRPAQVRTLLLSLLRRPLIDSRVCTIAAVALETACGSSRSYSVFRCAAMKRNRLRSDRAVNETKPVYWTSLTQWILTWVRAEECRFVLVRSWVSSLSIGGVLVCSTQHSASQSTMSGSTVSTTQGGQRQGESDCGLGHSGRVRGEFHRRRVSRQILSAGASAGEGSGNAHDQVKVSPPSSLRCPHHLATRS